MENQTNIWNCWDTLEKRLSPDEKQRLHHKYISPFTVEVRSWLNDWIQATFFTKRHLELDPNNWKDYYVVCSLVDALRAQIQFLQLNLVGRNCDLVISTLEEPLQTLNDAVTNEKKIISIYETIRQCLCSEIKLFQYIQMKDASSSTSSNVPQRNLSDYFSQVNSQLNLLNNILTNIRRSSLSGINGNVEEASTQTPVLVNQFLTKMQELYLQVELMQLKLVDEISAFNLSPSWKLCTLDQLQDNFVKLVEILRTCRGHLTQLLNKVKNEVAIEIQGKFLNLYNSLVQNSLVILDKPSRILIGKTNFQASVGFLGGSDFQLGTLMVSIVKREEMAKLIYCYNNPSKRIVSSDRKPEVSVDSSKGSKKKTSVLAKLKIKTPKPNAETKSELVLLNDVQERVLGLNVSSKLEGHIATFSMDDKGRRMAISKMKIKEIGKRIKKPNEKLVLDIEYFLIFHAQVTDRTSEENNTMWVYISSFSTRLLTNSSQEMKAMESMVWSSACSAGKTFVDVTKSVPWSQFINAVSHEFIRICGLGLNEPQLEFLREKALGSDHSSSHANLTLEQFRDTNLPGRDFTFAAWLCGILKLMTDCLKTLKQEPGVKMEPDAWCQCLIKGLNSKTEIEQKLLSTRKNGTTLVRFSETVLGGISVAYIVSDSIIRHMEPLTKDDWKESAFANCIMNLEGAITIYPNLPKQDVLKKYVEPEPEPKSSTLTGKYAKWNYFSGLFSRAKGLQTSNASASSQIGKSSPESFSENSAGSSSEDWRGPYSVDSGLSSQVSSEPDAFSPEVFSDTNTEPCFSDSDVFSFSDIETLLGTMKTNDFHEIAATLETVFQKYPEQGCISQASEFEDPNEGFVSPNNLALGPIEMDIGDVVGVNGTCYLNLDLQMPTAENNGPFADYSIEIPMANISIK